MKIDLKKLQESINKNAQVIYESLNTAEAKSLYVLVVDLYEEINAFEKEAPPAALNALSPHLQQVQSMLENMLREPLNYVSRAEDEESEEFESSDEDEMDMDMDVDSEEDEEEIGRA